MSAVAIPGRLGRFQVSTDGVVYYDVKGIVDQTLTINVDELETTSHDSAGHREYIPNFDDSTVDLPLRWLDSDVGQKLLLNSAGQKIIMQCKFFMDTVSGHTLWTGSCFVTSASISGPLDDVASFDVSLRMSGLGQSVQP